MKNKSTVFAVIAAALIIVIGSIAVSFAADTAAKPGSAEDPVVSKSYVDQKTSWTVLNVASGKTVIGGAGTQMILRSGSATAVDNGSDSVADLTAGADLNTGAKVETNHLLLIPRADGRGIKCTSECWVMVMGTYEIK